MLTLKGRTMVISGGAGNNGLAIVRAVIREGMNVAFFSSSTAKGEQAVLDLPEELRARAMGLSANDLGYDEAFRRVAERFGGVDVIVNGAGGHRHCTVEATDEREFDMCLRLLPTAFFTVKAALPYLERSPAPRVINLTTCEGRAGGYDSAAAQAAARGGLIALTQALARELGPRGITVNCLCIGPIEGDVPRFDTLTEEKRAYLLSRTPLGRLGVPGDLPAAVEFLASEEAGFVTGAVLDVNGGLIMA